MKTAVITGAGSGIGKAFAVKLSQDGYKTILAGRNKDNLERLSKELENSEIFCSDLEILQNCINLFEAYPDADIVINCAGCGVFGNFFDTSLESELSMLDINIRAVHIITKLYLKHFLMHDKGCILNVASSAAFFPGPLFSSYYASKSYVYRLTTSIYEELKHEKSNVKISVLCPGPVDTVFNQKAGVKKGTGAVTPEFVVNCAMKNLGKRVIVPGFGIKYTRFFSKLIPESITAKINYILQKKKY